MPSLYDEFKQRKAGAASSAAPAPSSPTPAPAAPAANGSLYAEFKNRRSAAPAAAPSVAAAPTPAAPAAEEKESWFWSTAKSFAEDAKQAVSLTFSFLPGFREAKREVIDPALESGRKDDAEIAADAARLAALREEAGPGNPLPARGFWETLGKIKEDPYQLVPFLSGVSTYGQYDQLLGAADRLKSGTATAKDEELLLNYAEENGRDSTFMGGVAGIVAQFPAFAGEIAASAGVGTGAKAVAKEAMEKTLGWAVSKEVVAKLKDKALARIAGKTVAVSVAGAAMTPLAGATRIPAETIKGIMPSVGVSDPAAGDIEAVIVAPGDDLESALVKAVGNQWVEVTSEMTGGAFTMAGKGIKNAAIKYGFLKAAAEANASVPAGTIAKVWKAAVERIGWHGLLGEMGEERVGEVMRGILTEFGVLDDGWQMPSLEQLAAEVVGFGAIQAGVSTVAYGAAQVDAALYDKRKGELLDAVRQDVRETGPRQAASALARELDITEREAAAVVATAVEQDGPTAAALKRAAPDDDVMAMIEDAIARIDARQAASGSSGAAETAGAAGSSSRAETARQDDSGAVEAIPDAVAERVAEVIDDLKAAGEETVAEEIWNAEYADGYAEAGTQIEALSSELAEAPAAEKPTVQAKIDAQVAEQARIETEFIKAGRQAAARAVVDSIASTGAESRGNDTDNENANDGAGADDSVQAGGGDLRRGADAAPARAGKKKPGRDGGDAPKPGRRVARGERGSRGAGAGERPGARVADRQSTKIGSAIVRAAAKAGVDLSDPNLLARLKAPGFMDLVIQSAPNGKVAVSHVYEQNGDLMRDPEVVFRVQNGALVAETIRNDGLMGGIERTILDSDEFLDLWAENIESQGFLDESASKDVPDEEAIEAAESRAEERAVTPEEFRAVLDRLTSVDPATGEVKMAQYEVKRDSRDWEVLTSGAQSVAIGGKGEEGKGALDEFYTPPAVVDMVREVIARLGDFGAMPSVLEPSVGTGALIRGIIDGDQSQYTPSVYAYEVNETAARVAKALGGGGMTVFNRPFEDVFIDGRGNPRQSKAEIDEGGYANVNGGLGYDLAVGNPPFGSHRGKYLGLGEEPKIPRYEEYFLKRAIDTLDKDGAAVFIMPSGWLRSGASHGKSEISKKAALVAAYRLPNGAFPTTDVGVDIVVFKREDAADEAAAVGRSRKIAEDRYFGTAEGAGNILGAEMERKGRFGTEVFVTGRVEDAADMLRARLEIDFAKTVAENPADAEEVAAIADESNDVYNEAVYQEAKPKTAADMSNVEIAEAMLALPKRRGHIDIDAVPAPERAAAIAVVDENARRMEAAKQKKIESKRAAQEAAGFVAGAAVVTDLPGIGLEDGQLARGVLFDRAGTLRVRFDARTAKLLGTSKHSEPLDSRWRLASAPLAPVTAGDTVSVGGEAATVVQELPEGRLEVKKRGGKKAIVSASDAVDVRPAPDAAPETISLSRYSVPSEGQQWEFVSADGSLRGAFDPALANYQGGAYYNDFHYASGDIYAKLDALETDRAAGKIDAERAARQRAKLEAARPERHGVDRIALSPNAAIAEQITLADGRQLRGAFLEWITTLPMGAFGASNKYDVRAYANSEPVRGADKVANETARRERRTQGDRLFKLFIRENLPAADQEAIVDAYNRRFNSYVKPDYRQVPLVGQVAANFHGAPLEIKDVQLQGVGFLVSKGVGLLAHDVGVGKTMQTILAINETMARGWAKRPLIVLPSAQVYHQWAAEIAELIPGAKLNMLANLGGDFKGNLAELEVPEGTISLITDEGFKRLGFKEETYEDLTRDLLDAIEDPDAGTERERQREAAKAEAQVGAGIRGTSDKRFFEDLGFDLLAVDEVHNANHIIARAKMGDGKVSEYRGLQVRPSQFGIKTWLAAQYVQKMNGGRNVFLASATPFTNNPLEYYSILSLMARDRMAQMGLTNVNDFMTMFMELSTQLEAKADGSYVEKSDIRGFRNYQTFRQLLGEFIDFRDGAEAGVKRPERLPREAYVSATPAALALSAKAQELFKDKAHAGTLRAIEELRAIAFSPYLSQFSEGGLPSAPEVVDNSPKLRAAVELIAETLRNRPEGGQLVYSTVGVELFPVIREEIARRAGIPIESVQLITGSTPKPRRQAIQAAFNAGTVKVVVGSDAIQEGINLQRNTTDLYILSLPWNFTQIKQVIGRAWRQGNRWRKVRVTNVFTENSIDVFLSQKLQNKQRRYEESLRYQGDTLDVGDIDFETLKFDLITDPAARAELEGQFRAQAIRLEIARAEAEAAYQARAAAKLVDARSDIARAKATAERYGNAEWAAEGVRRAERGLADVVRNLSDRGVDVAAAEAALAAAQAEIETFKKKLDDELAATKAATAAAALEAGPFAVAPEETDFNAIVAERRRDNETFYDGGPLFERAPETEPDALATRYGAAVTTGIMEALRGKAVVSKQYVVDLTRQTVVKDAERAVIEEALAEMPDGPKVNVDLFLSKAAAKLLPLSSGFTTRNRYAGVTLRDEDWGDYPNASYQERIYQSPIPTDGRKAHFASDNVGGESIRGYFAHSRFEDLLEDGGEQGTRRVLEIQSDLFQKGNLERSVAVEGGDRTMGQVAKDTAKLEPYRNTWHERVIREEIRQAALDGKTELRFPTGETAMKIEGLAESSWRMEDENGDSRELTPQELDEYGVGLIVYQVADYDESEKWIVTEIGEDGKFRAVLAETLISERMDGFNVAPGSEEYRAIRPKVEDEVYGAPGKAVEWLKDKSGRYMSLTEGFDVNAGDKSNPIYRFYDVTVRRFLKKIRPEMEEITDDAGVDWLSVKITPEDAERPVLAFQRDFAGFKMRATTFAEAKAQLEAYQKRLGLTFDVDFAHAIFTGEYEAGTGFQKGAARRAYAVTYNNKITLTDNVTRTTADHELVHMVMFNLAKLRAFDGITMDALLREANGGKDYRPEDVERLSERVAVGFERYVANREMAGETVTGRFYRLLLDLITDLFRALGADIPAIADFYDRLARAEGAQAVTLRPREDLDQAVRRTVAGRAYLDFGLEAAEARRADARAAFERAADAEAAGDLDYRNTLAKDINQFEKLTAQAHDVYLKDPAMFAAADAFERIAAKRRARKAALDERFTTMLAPYFSLPESPRGAVDRVLMEGDEAGKEFDDAQLRAMGLSSDQAAAYRAVRRAFNVAHEVLLAEMVANGVSPEEIDEYRQSRVGYMPHKWAGRYAVKTQRREAGEWKTVEMGAYKTERAMRAAVEAQKPVRREEYGEGAARRVFFYLDPDTRIETDKLESVGVDFFAEQRLSFEAIKSAMSQAKAPEDIKRTMIDAVRNIVKEKGFGRNFIRRTGVRGYERREVPRVVAEYFSGLDGFVTKMEAGKAYYDALSTVDARRQKQFYEWLRDSIAYDMGHTYEWEWVKKIAFVYYLSNDLSYLLVNTLQNLTVGAAELGKHLVGADKLTAEVRLAKAGTDWLAGNVTADERGAIEGLLALGQLGGEMAAELTGFKNNPLYATVSSGLSKFLYTSSTLVERNVNRVPAFLAAYRAFRAQGASEAEATDRALTVSEDIHFRYGKQHRAAFMRGAGAPLTVFMNYIRSFLYALHRDIKGREYLALARKMVWTVALGGVTSLPFAKLLASIFKEIFEGDGDDEAAEEMTKWDVLIQKGAPAAFAGIDLSGRVSIDVFAIGAIIEDPNAVLNYLGAAGSISERLFQAVDLAGQGRWQEALGKGLPDALANPIKADYGYRHGVTSFAGTPLEDSDGEPLRYSAWEAIVKATGFTPTRESLAWEALGREYDAKDEVSAARSEVRREVRGAVNRGDIEAARAAQAAALAAGIIEEDADYVREFAKGGFVDAAAAAWESSAKTQEDRARIEGELLTQIYGDAPTARERASLRKEFAVVREFGTDDPVVADLRSASTNAERADVLAGYRKEMGEDAFRAWLVRARKETTLPSGSPANILVSDDLLELFKKRWAAGGY